MSGFTPGQPITYSWKVTEARPRDRAAKVVEAQGIFLSYVGKASAKVRFDKPGGTVIQTVALSKLRGRE